MARLIGKLKTTPSENAGAGIWGINEQAAFKRDGLWPILFTVARYWRLLQTQESWNTAAGAYHGAFLEVKMFPTQNASGSPLSGSVFTASTITPSYPASNAFDLNAGTYWATTSPAPTPHWISVDFGSSARVSSVYIQPFDGGGGNSGYYAKEYVLQYSDDDTNWTTLATLATNSGLGEQTFTNLNPAS
jgi:hypothetical protein